MDMLQLTGNVKNVPPLAKHVLKPKLNVPAAFLTSRPQMPTVFVNVLIIKETVLLVTLMTTQNVTIVKMDSKLMIKENVLLKHVPTDKTTVSLVVLQIFVQNVTINSMLNN